MIPSIESERKLASPDSDIQNPKPAKQRRPLLIAAVVIGIAIVIAAATWLLINPGRESTNDAYLEGPIVRISPKVSGQVVKLNVNDNTPVKAGDVLLEIDSTDYRAKVDQATAVVVAADHSVKQAQAQVISSEAMIGQAQAGLQSAQSNSKQKDSDLKRYTAIGTEGISLQRLDTARSAAESAADDRDAADKKLAAARASLTVANTAVALAKAQVVAAQAQLHLAQINLEWTRVIAPVSGRVTERNVEAGAFVSTGQPLFAIVPDELWVLGNFKEVQLTQMHVGQSVELRVDAFPDRHLTGRLQSLQAGTGARFELLPPENATGNWVKVVQRVPVKITLDPGQNLTDLAQGMSAEVTVDTQGSGDGTR